MSGKSVSAHKPNVQHSRPELAKKYKKIAQRCDIHFLKAEYQRIPNI